MKGALEAQRKTCTNARHDIDRLAKQTVTALDNVGVCSKGDWDFAFSVLAAVASIGAIPLTGGASAGVAAVGAAGAVGNAASAGSSVQAKGGGGSAEQIIKSMKHDIEKLTEAIRKAEEKISKALSGIEGEINKDKRAFVSKKPELAGMHGKDLTGDHGLGRST